MSQTVSDAMAKLNALSASNTQNAFSYINRMCSLVYI